jgi:predicted GNAT family acetyltransferase
MRDAGHLKRYCPIDVLRLDPAAALDLVGEPLLAARAEGELSHGILTRVAADPAAYGTDVLVLVGTRDGEPLALVSKTGAFPALVTGFGEPADVDFATLAHAMLDAGVQPDSTNGPVRWVEPFVIALTDLGASTTAGRATRAFELHTLRSPRNPGGAYRDATTADAGVLVPWTVAMGDDIEEPIGEDAARASVERLTGNGDFAVWERDDAIVSMAAVVRRTPRSSSIAFVYTPPDMRGRGYASAVVAALSKRELDHGAHWCSLFTDLANPTSNHIYTALGYEPRADFQMIELRW